MVEPLGHRARKHLQIPFQYEYEGRTALYIVQVRYINMYMWVF